MLNLFRLFLSDMVGIGINYLRFNYQRGSWSRLLFGVVLLKSTMSQQSMELATIIVMQVIASKSRSLLAFDPRARGTQKAKNGHHWPQPLNSKWRQTKRARARALFRPRNPHFFLRNPKNSKEMERHELVSHCVVVGFFILLDA